MNPADAAQAVDSARDAPAWIQTSIILLAVGLWIARQVLDMRDRHAGRPRASTPAKPAVDAAAVAAAAERETTQRIRLERVEAMSVETAQVVSLVPRLVEQLDRSCEALDRIEERGRADEHETKRTTERLERIERHVSAIAHRTGAGR